MKEKIRIGKTLQDVYVNKIRDAVICFRGSYRSDPKYLLLSQQTYKLLLEKIKEISSESICELCMYNGLKVMVTVRKDIDFALW